MTVIVIFIIQGLLGSVYAVLHHDICTEIMYVDCKAEALPGNKLYRDNNGKIYDNFCLYSQAKCRDTSKDIDAVCTCVHPSFGAHTTLRSLIGSSTTQRPVPITQNKATTPMTSPNTTPITPLATTTRDLLIEAFCKNKNSVICGTELAPICASDRKFYLNRCEFSKAKCDYPNLSKHENKFCTGI